MLGLVPWLIGVLVALGLALVIAWQLVAWSVAIVIGLVAFCLPEPAFQRLARACGIPFHKRERRA